MIKRYLRALALLIVVFFLSACYQEKLLYNLTQEQANQVLAILQQHNISASKEGTAKAGYNVTVGNADNTVALSIINQYKLPWPADVQIAQAFPESSLVASPQAEQVRVLSLQEQRLEQSLRIIDQVVNARVHVSYPSFNIDSGARKTEGHVGVIISFKGEIDGNILITQIKTLIKNSFDDVRYENISVVLFPAPVIQYVAPGKVARSLSLQWIIILSVTSLMAIAALAYMLYKFRLRPDTYPKPPALGASESTET